MRIKSPPIKSAQDAMEEYDEAAKFSDGSKNIIAEDGPQTAAKNKRSTHLKSNFEVATINLRLQLPGILDILLPVPAPPTANGESPVTVLFKQFEHEYWNQETVLGKKSFKCLICNATLTSRRNVECHLAKHVGFPLIKCKECSTQMFYMSGVSRHSCGILQQ